MLRKKYGSSGLGNSQKFILFSGMTGRKNYPQIIWQLIKLIKFHEVNNARSCIHMKIMTLISNETGTMLCITCNDTGKYRDIIFEHGKHMH